jgi:RNA-directed DNA polymerase
MSREKLQQRPAHKDGALVGGERQKRSRPRRRAGNSEVADVDPFFKPENLMEAVVERSNMNEALIRVERNAGAAGVDGMSTTELRPYLHKHWKRIKEKLLKGDYLPQPVRRVEIEKPDGGVRLLGIPTVLDRLIQQAVNQVLSEVFEPTFSKWSYGFRPKRSAQEAVIQAQQYAEREDRRIVVDLDLEKFFDRVNHDILMERIARKVKEKILLKLIRCYLEAGVMIGGLVEVSEEGTPQGGPLSPLLSNIMLDDLDKELERRHHRFCRYADDCNIYVRSQRAGERVKQSVTRFLEKHLKLKVNEKKSAAASVTKRKFLGYSMTPGKIPRLKPAPQSLKRLKQKVRVLFRKGRGRNVEKFIEEDLNPLLRGWIQYFKLCRVKGVFEELDKWLRRKLRGIYWRQWKRGHTRCKRLIELGIDVDRARLSSVNGRGPWWNAGASHLSQALPIKYFGHLGLISLWKEIQRLSPKGASP